MEEKKVLLKSGSIGLAMVICWSRAFPGIVELVKDEQGKVIDLKLVEEAEPLSELELVKRRDFLGLPYLVC